MVNLSSFSDELFELGYKYEELQEIGERMRYYGDTRTIQEMRDLMWELGLDEAAAAFDSDFVKNNLYYIDLYMELYGISAAYSEESEMWHDTVTGQFLPNPYDFFYEEHMTEEDYYFFIRE